MHVGRFWLARPRGRTLIVADRRTGYGLNLHRRGGVSITGVPRSGGTTLCWGRLRRHCESIDRNPCAGAIDATVLTRGPFMLRIGPDF